MKADVLPATVPPKLDIPSWVPDAIAQSVSTGYAAAVDRVYEAALRESDWFEPDFLDDVPREHLYELIRDDVVLRERIADLVRDELVEIAERYLPLACDPRMKSVWGELSRQKAIDIDQDAATLELFNTAFVCQRRWGATTTTRRQAEQQRNDYFAKADALRYDAIKMLTQPGGDDALDMLTQLGDAKCHRRFQKLMAAAQAYKDYASEIHATSSAMALERQHDGRARWVALTIGDKFRTLFGSPMYGLTATITSVILDREIDRRTTRQWLSSGPKTTRPTPMRKFAAVCHSAVKCQKSSP